MGNLHANADNTELPCADLKSAMWGKIKKKKENRSDMSLFFTWNPFGLPRRGLGPLK